MDPDSDFQEAMDLTEEYLSRADEEIEIRGDLETIDGGTQTGFMVNHGNHQLQIICDDGSWYFMVQYQYAVFEPLARKAAIDEATGGSEPPEGEIELEIQARHLQAGIERAVDILDSQDDEKKAQLRNKFVNRLSTPYQGLSYGLVEAIDVADTDVQGVVGLTTKSRIWPYSESFSPSSVHLSCQAVVSNGLPVASLLQRQFGIQAELGVTTESSSYSSPDDRDPRGFQ